MYGGQRQSPTAARHGLVVVYQLLALVLIYSSGPAMGDITRSATEEQSQPPDERALLAVLSLPAAIDSFGVATTPMASVVVEDGATSSTESGEGEQPVEMEEEEEREEDNTAKQALPVVLDEGQPDATTANRTQRKSEVKDEDQEKEQGELMDDRMPFKEGKEEDNEDENAGAQQKTGGDGAEVGLSGTSKTADSMFRPEDPGMPAASEQTSAAEPTVLHLLPDALAPELAVSPVASRLPSHSSTPSTVLDTDPTVDFEPLASGGASSGEAQGDVDKASPTGEPQTLVEAPKEAERGEYAAIKGETSLITVIAETTLDSASEGSKDSEAIADQAVLTAAEASPHQELGVLELAIERVNKSDADAEASDDDRTLVQSAGMSEEEKLEATLPSLVVMASDQVEDASSALPVPASSQLVEPSTEGKSAELSNAEVVEVVSGAAPLPPTSSTDAPEGADLAANEDPAREKQRSQGLALKKQKHAVNETEEEDGAKTKEKVAKRKLETQQQQRDRRLSLAGTNQTSPDGVPTAAGDRLARNRTRPANDTVHHRAGSVRSPAARSPSIVRAGAEKPMKATTEEKLIVVQMKATGAGAAASPAASVTGSAVPSPSAAVSAMGRKSTLSASPSSIIASPLASGAGRQKSVGPSASSPWSSPAVRSVTTSSVPGNAAPWTKSQAGGLRPSERSDHKARAEDDDATEGDNDEGKANSAERARKLAERKALLKTAKEAAGVSSSVVDDDKAWKWRAKQKNKEIKRKQDVPAYGMDDPAARRREIERVKKLKQKNQGSLRFKKNP